MEIAKLMRERRLELGLTMKQLGQKVGVTTATVSRWESGEISALKAETITLEKPNVETVNFAPIKAGVNFVYIIK